MQDLVMNTGFALETGVDERAARRELRRQIGRLERELGALLGEAFGRVEIEHRVATAPAEPRILDLGGLERVRDGLAERVAEARATLARRAEVETTNRELLRRMLADPAAYKWVTVSRAEVGALGILMGWWRVKVSSGCPLAGRLAAVERQTPSRAGAPAAHR
jgi:hypothetical protein